MTDYEFTVEYLKAIEKQYKDYFDTARRGIMSCVVIEGKKLVTVHITEPDLPAEIKHDIEMMFWVE
ncbi:hypothetical protein [Mucilaginibacter sp. UR6-11]|uniref:hypothetical protein n=1 Tax=Mucilaginibacter sp. UR6-11 TaxID=1435644 RepID=UPI001E596C92|nr:hypothetical protein [Mucilaginibacter sp. UR6-11]MCC8425784.1 hypothetical protein [Mucilaginibacter sp. UR6-11]